MKYTRVLKSLCVDVTKPVDDRRVLRSSDMDLIPKRREHQQSRLDSQSKSSIKAQHSPDCPNRLT